MPLDLTINGQPVDHQQARQLLESVAVAEDPMPTVTDPPVVTDGVLSEAGALREASAESGRAVIRIIEAGQGSSGLYPEDTLREAAEQRVFHTGTAMFMDHPTASESYERPERSVRDLAGRLTSDARYEDGALVAEAEVFPHWRELIGGMHEHIGVSIRADGRIDESGTVREITRARSVDYVTEAGAGGRVLELVESARTEPLREARNAGQWIESRLHLQFTEMTDMLAAEGHITREERMALSGAIGDALSVFNARVSEDVPQLYDRDPFAEPTAPGMPSGASEAPQGADTEEAAMPATTAPADGATTETTTINITNPPVDADAATGQTAQESSVTEALAVRDERITALERQLRERDARTTVDAIVREAVDLPEQARQRAAGSVDLESDDLAEATRQALDAERAYVAEVRRSLGVGRVTGMGEAQTTTSDGPRTVEDYQKLGLSETDAKAAAAIHS